MAGGTAALSEIHRGRLFLASCVSLIATSVTFAVIGAIMGALKTEFVLTNQQVGHIGGAALWGFPISILIFGPLCDVLGMRLLFRLAFVFHAVGVLLMIFATGFWMLLFGALTIAFGNGLVEAAGNPLVATIYPDRKTEKLNQFHVWFPGGIVIGGLIAFFLDKVGIPSWQLKLSVILVPTVIYGLLFLGQKFPLTERVQSGLSFKDMVAATFGRPLFLLLLFCMMLTASVELGPNRWIPSILESGGFPGILVLVYISLLMAVLRQLAGQAVERLAPTGILLGSSILAGIGLWLLSDAEGFVRTFAAATVFAIGVCYFWPTMLGVASERVPKGGALALALLGAVGNIAVGAVAIPGMGRVADYYAHEQMHRGYTKVCLRQITENFPTFIEQAEGDTAKDYQHAIDLANDALAQVDDTGALPPILTENALRAAMKFAGGAPEDTEEWESQFGETEGLQRAQFVATKAKMLMNPADNFGGRMAFKWISPLTLILMVIFGGMYLRDRASGGYRAEKILPESHAS